MKRPARHPESGRVLTPPGSLRALIVDDETLARQGIRMLLDQDAEIGVVEEAGNGKRAAELMLTGSFDLIFLDVQMPEMDGFAALRRGGAKLRGAVIFVTAYDQYAVEAFEVNAADYLLKPFTPRRFRQSLQRAKARIHDGSQGTDARVLAVLERIASPPTYLNRIAVRGAGGTSFVDTKNVDWATAAENYVELHVGRDCYLVEVTMAEIAKRLDPARFVRIHRSVIVNVGRIRNVQSASHSEYLVTLACGVQLRSGRTYSKTLQRLISNPF
ncbi:MAG TPA: LytTR family DNA-binding domain-containing protein [Terriglobales bacterium]|jgi:two-component system LytT family response regulator|nr:LytTR family DNA-binding domain-containing protein [Terriglobales bacterium]